MPFRKWLRDKNHIPLLNIRSRSSSAVDDIHLEEPPNRRTTQINNDQLTGEDIFIVYYAKNTPIRTVIDILQSLSENEIKLFRSEEDLINYISSISDKKMFLVIDNEPSESLLHGLESLSQIDSLFIYSSSSNRTKNPITNLGLISQCSNEESLAKAIRESRQSLEKQTAAFTLYNQKEKAIRDLSKESGSFLFFQLFKTVLMNMPKTMESKKMMLEKCRDYYRGNTKELANIAEFDLTYKSNEAIQWYTKQSFVYKVINKALRTEDVELLYHFRYYIIDLCQQLEFKFAQLKKKEKDILKLYRGFKLSQSEIKIFQENLGNLISKNGYLSTSRLHSVAYTFAKKPSNREGIVMVIFQYEIDLNQVTKIVLADVAEYSNFPDEAEVLIDIGASFRIHSCIFDTNENLWNIIVQATDQGADLANEFIEYQKKKMADANIVLMFGHLLIEMGEYNKAQKYFDTVLSSNPNDEEIACIYFNFGRAYRLKGDFHRSMDYYQRAFHLHQNAKPKRRASAAKALNGLGVAASEQGNQKIAIEYFQRALKLLCKSVHPYHIDIAGTIINLASIYCDQKQYDQALKNCLHAMQIYKRSLPSAHPNNALAQVVLANIYLGIGEHDKALLHYHQAMILLQTALPADHPDLARAIHNLALAYERQGNLSKAIEYFHQANDLAQKTLSSEHPLINLIHNSLSRISNTLQSHVTIRL